MCCDGAFCGVWLLRGPVFRSLWSSTAVCAAQGVHVTHASCVFCGCTLVCEVVQVARAGMVTLSATLLG
jgi:hypothetical protein